MLKISLGDIKKTPKAEAILEKIKNYFKPHVAQHKTIVRNKFLTTKIKDTNFRSLLRKFDLIIEECNRASYKPTADEMYEVLMSCLQPRDRVHILSALDEQTYVLLRAKLEKMMQVEYREQETAEQSSAYSKKMQTNKKNLLKLKVPHSQNKSPPNDRNVDKINNTPQQRNNLRCRWCGYNRHKREECPAKDKTCDICHKVGHLSRQKNKK
eukprot:GHVR01054618.1.p1 GENE.GHVR01054618.1~~GHVR01054618.1.p1  ORF type:complete len:211 (+),score=21.34 GHVR01054618.1:395-1027(+)